MPAIEKPRPPALVCRRPALFLVALIVASALPACSPTPVERLEPEPETLYPWGAQREQLESRHGRVPVYYMGSTDAPADDFARATIREMLAAGKPRPVAYQVFPVARVPDGLHYHDYVFYDRNGRVIYVARYVPA